MKYLQWLNKAGKTSMASLAGLGGLVTVAGVASWMYINNTDDGNSFNLGGQQETQIVYSSGGNNDYSNYAAQEGGSSVGLASSRNLKIIEQEELRVQQQKELAESERNAQQAYATAPASRLAGNSDYNGEAISGFESMLGGDKNPLKSLGDLQGKMSQAMSGGESAAGAPAAGGRAGGSTKQGPAALASGKRDWTQSAALAGRGGSSGAESPNQFVLQANGRGETAASTGDMPDFGEAFKQAQQEAAKLVEGSRINGNASRASFNGNRLGNGIDSSAARARERAESLDRLKFAQKRSAQEAANKNRMAVTTAFLDGNRITGGMTLDNGVNVTTGQGQESKDFNTSFQGGLGKMGEVAQEIAEEEYQRHEDRVALQTKMWNTVTFVAAMMLLIVWAIRMAKLNAAHLNFGVAAAFWAAAGVFTALGVAAIGAFFNAGNHFFEQWGETTMRDLTYVVSGLGLVGLGGAWTLGAFAKEAFLAKFSSVLGMLGGAMGVTSGMGLVKK